MNKDESFSFLCKVYMSFESLPPVRHEYCEENCIHAIKYLHHMEEQKLHVECKSAAKINVDDLNHVLAEKCLQTPGSPALGVNSCLE